MRDCKNCIHRTKNGCDSWDCEFEKEMTNEEAIKVLEIVEAHGIADRAKRMAIRALKNEQTEGDLQKEIDFWHIKCTEYEQTIVKMAVELNDIKAIPSAEKNNFTQLYATTDGDLISRDFMKKLGATCIAKRSETGELVAISSIDNLPSAEKIATFKIVGNTKKPYKCSKCDGDVDGWDKYCKHCGARLVL